MPTRTPLTETAYGSTFQRTVRIFGNALSKILSESFPVTFVNVTDPYGEPPSPEMQNRAQTPAQDGYVTPRENWDGIDPFPDGAANAHTRLSEAALMLPQSPTYHVPAQKTLANPPGNEKDSMAPPISPRGHFNPSSRDLDFILNPPDASSPLDPELQPPFMAQQLTESQSPAGATEWVQPKASTETGREVAFLLRHFSEATGQWHVHHPPSLIVFVLTVAGWTSST